MGDRLRKARLDAGYEVEDMAVELGVHRNTVTRYETGASSPNRGVRFMWATLTRVPLHWLETGEPAEERRQEEKTYRGKDRRQHGHQSQLPVQYVHPYATRGLHLSLLGQ